MTRTRPVGAAGDGEHFGRRFVDDGLGFDGFFGLGHGAVGEGGDLDVVVGFQLYKTFRHFSCRVILG